MYGSNNMKKSVVFNNQFTPKLGGQFELESGGQFAPKLVVNLHWNRVVNLTGFSTITADFFPRQTREDKSIFKLLKQQPNTLRFSKTNDVDYLYYQVVEERCKNFKNQAEILIQKELERLSQIEIIENQITENKK